MTTSETLLVEALRDHERLAPDPTVVLAGLGAGIARRRRRRRFQGMAAVALATVAAVTVGVAAVGGLRAGPPHPAAPSPTVTEWRSTLAFGWLPAGLNRPVVTSTKIHEAVLYPGSGGRYLRLEVSNVSWTPTLDLPGWRRTVVNAHPASELSQPARSFVVFRLPSGRWAELELGEGYGNSGNSQPALHNEAARVAKAVREDGDRKLRAGFTLHHLPAGQRVIGVSRAEPGPNSFEEIVCASGSLRVLGKNEVNDSAGSIFEGPRVDEGQVITIRVSSSTLGERQLQSVGRRLPDIAGRTTYAVNEGRMVVVLDFHGRELIVTGSSRPAVPLTELVKVAAGVRLT